jgi:hypothetical protein
MFSENKDHKTNVVRVCFEEGIDLYEPMIEGFSYE